MYINKGKEKLNVINKQTTKRTTHSTSSANKDKESPTSSTNKDKESPTSLANKGTEKQYIVSKQRERKLQHHQKIEMTASVQKNKSRHTRG